MRISWCGILMMMGEDTVIHCSHASSTPLMHRECEVAQPVERPLTVKYVEESPPLRLDDAVKYFGRSIAREFRVTEGAYNPKGRREGVAKGECVYKHVYWVYLALRTSNSWSCRCSAAFTA